MKNTPENCFAPQNEPHTAILSFSGILKRFRPKLTKKTPLISFLKEISQKVAKDYLGRTFYPSQTSVKRVLSCKKQF